MAKFIKSFEEGAIENKLIFRNKEFTVTMMPDGDGCLQSKEKCMGVQLTKTFPNDEDIQDISELVEFLWCSDDDEIQESLEELEQFE